MEEYYFWILIALLCIILFLLSLFMSYKNKKDMLENTRKMNEQLLSFQSNMIHALNTDMNTMNDYMLHHLDQMEKSMNEQIEHSFQFTNQAYTTLIKEAGKIDENTKHLQALSGDIVSLHRILNDKKTRGIYGEFELYSLLERFYGNDTNFYKKQYKLSNGCIVDAVLLENDVLNMIPIDSKFPLENYNRLQIEDLSVAQKKVLLNEFKYNMKKHIDDIHKKYLIVNETSEFALLFIPAEAIFSYIHTNLPEIIEYSYEQKVYLTSPSTLMAYVSAIKSFYLGRKKSERMEDIERELVELSLEFERFIKRYETLIKDYEKVGVDLKNVMVSAKKISKHFNKIENVEFDDN